MAAVCLDEDAAFRKCGNQFQIAGGKLLLELAVSLPDHLYDVQGCHLQLDVARACLGGFDQVFGQVFKTLGLLIQDF